MQTPGALNQQVHGRQVADHLIEVQVQGLLHHLGANQNPAGAGFGSGRFAEPFQCRLFYRLAVRHDKATVKKHDLVRVRRPFAENLIRGNGIVHGVAYPATALAALCRIKQMLDHRLRFVEHFHRHPANHAVTGGERRLFQALIGNPGGQRERWLFFHDLRSQAPAFLVSRNQVALHGVGQGSGKQNGAAALLGVGLQDGFQ